MDFEVFGPDAKLHAQAEYKKFKKVETLINKYLHDPTALIPGTHQIGAIAGNIVNVALQEINQANETTCEIESQMQ